MDEIDSIQPSALGLALLLKLKHKLDTAPINKTDIENLCCLSHISIYKDKKQYSIVLLNHYQLISPELYDKFIDLLLIDFCCSSFINDQNFFIKEFTNEFLPQIPFESFVSYLNDNETRIDCFEEILYYIDNFLDDCFNKNNEEEIVEEEGERTGSLLPIDNFLDDLFNYIIFNF